ncbi:hypothetical protein BTVI_53893 [Pitangus sulphuratus]|nr:hypothetical protein BTVI_53893 [Pitangus sulphuratus]
MFASQGDEACANIIPSIFYLTVAADSGNKVPKISVERRCSKMVGDVLLFQEKRTRDSLTFIWAEDTLEMNNERFYDDIADTNQNLAFSDITGKRQDVAKKRVQALEIFELLTLFCTLP